MSTTENLRQVAFFAGLEPGDLEQLAAIAERREFPAGRPIYAEGEADASLFVVAAGKVRLDKLVNSDQRQTLQHLQDGDFFGEVSFIGGGQHSASATALEDTAVIQIRRTEFDRLAARNPVLAYTVMLRMAGQLASLLRSMDERLVQLIGYIWGRAKG